MHTAQDVRDVLNAYEDALTRGHATSSDGDFKPDVLERSRYGV